MKIGLLVTDPLQQSYSYISLYDLYVVTVFEEKNN